MVLSIFYATLMNVSNVSYFFRFGGKGLKATIRSSYEGVADILAGKLCHWQIVLHLRSKQIFSAKSPSNPLIRRPDVSFRRLKICRFPYLIAFKYGVQYKPSSLKSFKDKQLLYVSPVSCLVKEV